MAIDEIREDRKNGVFYTPPELAEFLAEPLLRPSNLSILDPAYGEGSLLLAAERIYSRIPNSRGLSLFGCDIKPVNGLLNHLPEANLVKTDFFDYPTDRKFDLILMNPPYVRHHLLDAVWMKKYRATYPELKQINNSSDLWAYFIIKSILHLKENGSIGAILPWSFLQADYSQPLRTWLAGNFREIKVLGLNKKYFENAEARVVLVWLNRYGEKCSKFQIGSAKNIDEKINYSDISVEQWTSNKITFNSIESTNHIFETYESVFGFSKFGIYADIKIGIVSGADKYFVLPVDRARELGFKKRHLIPVLRSTKELADILRSGTTSLKNLLVLQEKDESLFKSYLRLGKKMGIDLTAHSKQRGKWYSVKTGSIPDAFFPYRVSKIPFVVNNDFEIQCTNSIHRIYFKGLSKTEMKWVHVGLLSEIGQLSIETNAKTYGKGMLKIEPGALKKVLVIKRNDRSIENVHRGVYKLLAQGDKEGAMKVATEFINRALNISPEISSSVSLALKQSYQIRLSS